MLVPGVGMFSFGANKQTARVAGEFSPDAVVARWRELFAEYGAG